MSDAGERTKNPNSVAADLLGGIAVFAAFSRQETEELFGRGRVEERQSAANIVIEGERSRGLFIILSGRVSIFKNNQLTGEMHRLAHLEAGDNFGELSLLDDSPRSATVVAETLVRLFYLDHSVFELFLQEGGFGREARFYRQCAMILVERFRRQNGDYIEAQQLLWQHAMRLPNQQETPT